MPTKETMFFTFSGIFFLVVPSTIKTSNCQPSKPGNGKRLKIAKLTEIDRAERHRLHLRRLVHQRRLH